MNWREIDSDTYEIIIYTRIHVFQKCVFLCAYIHIGVDAIRSSMIHWSQKLAFRVHAYVYTGTYIHIYVHIHIRHIYF